MTGAVGREVTPLTTYYYSASVRLETIDPPNIALCWTRNRLNWKTYEDTSYWYNDVTSSFVDAWAANPTPWPLNTHWNIDSYGGSWTKDNWTEIITHDVYGYYHNYDFLNDDERTDVQHNIEIVADKFGDFTYDTFFDAWGEAHALLRSNLYVNE